MADNQVGMTSAADLILRRLQRKNASDAGISAGSTIAATSAAATGQGARLVSTVDGVQVEAVRPSAAPLPGAAALQVKQHQVVRGTRPVALPSSSSARPRPVDLAALPPAALDQPALTLRALSVLLGRLSGSLQRQGLMSDLAAISHDPTAGWARLALPPCDGLAVPCLPVGLEAQASELASFLRAFVGGHASGSMALIGLPGSGKRTLLRHCLRQAVAAAGRLPTPRQQQDLAAGGSNSPASTVEPATPLPRPPAGDVPELPRSAGATAPCSGFPHADASTAPTADGASAAASAAAAASVSVVWVSASSCTSEALLLMDILRQCLPDPHREPRWMPTELQQPRRPQQQQQREGGAGPADQWLGGSRARSSSGVVASSDCSPALSTKRRRLRADDSCHGAGEGASGGAGMPAGAPGAPLSSEAPHIPSRLLWAPAFDSVASGGQQCLSAAATPREPAATARRAAAGAFPPKAVAAFALRQHAAAAAQADGFGCGPASLVAAQQRRALRIASRLLAAHEADGAGAGGQSDDTTVTGPVATSRVSVPARGADSAAPAGGSATLDFDVYAPGGALLGVTQGGPLRQSPVLADCEALPLHCRSTTAPGDARPLSPSMAARAMVLDDADDVGAGAEVDAGSNGHFALETASSAGQQRRKRRAVASFDALPAAPVAHAAAMATDPAEAAGAVGPADGGLDCRADAAGLPGRDIESVLSGRDQASDDAGWGEGRSQATSGAGEEGGNRLAAAAARRLTQRGSAPVLRSSELRRQHLRSLVSALFSASQRRLLLVVEDVEVIAQRDPSLLYFLLDAPLAARARVALLGLTSSVGLPGMLEKRFRSRLADRIVLLPPPSPLQLALRLERALRLPPLRALCPHPQEGDAGAAHRQSAAAEAASALGSGPLPGAPASLGPPPPAPRSAAFAAYALYRRHWRASVVRVLCHPSFGLAHAAHPAACEAGFTLSAADYMRRLLQAVVALQGRLALAAAAAQQPGPGGARRGVLAFPLLSISDVPPLLPAPGLTLVPACKGSGSSSSSSHDVPPLHPWLRLPAGMARRTLRAAALPADAGVEACLAPLSALPSPHLCLLVAMAHIEVRDRHKGVAGAGARSAAFAAAAAAAGLAPGPSAAALDAASSADGQALSPGAVEGGGARYNFNRVFHELRSAMSDGSGGTSAVTAAIRAGQSGATAGRGASAPTGGAAASAAAPVSSSSAAARHLPEKGAALAAFRQCVLYGLVRLLPPASSTGAAGAGTLSSRVLGAMEGAARGGPDGDGRAASAAAAASSGRGSAAGVASLATSAALWSGRELAVGSLAGVGLEHVPCRLLLDPDALLATLRGRQGAAVLGQVDAAVRSFLAGAGRVAPGSL